ncbi:MAG: PIN domain-containing protein [Candidatus Poribacteria bacterium]|nr:PIN domain-containing protein [Candidatus Poribacteria bacterium]
MIFVDTGAWLALLNQRDQHHHDAVAVFNDLRQQRSRLLTTDYVIDETVTRVRYDTNHALSVLFLNRIELLEETGVLTIAGIDKNVFEAAKVLFRQYDSVRLSFTDCTSFVICRVNNISEAFAFDRHFPIMGIDLRQ